MNEAPKGKIGRLPQAIQDQVNRRLEQGEKARTLVAWLNVLPEVQAVLAAEFAGKPIREQNLSAWRKNGYQKWLLHHHAWEMTQATTSTPDQPLTDQMAGWVTAHYLLAIRKLMEASPGGGPDLKTLRALLHDVVAVRRGDHRAARVQMEWERLAANRRKISGEFPKNFRMPGTPG